MMSKEIRCLYCGAIIPEKTEDSKGRKHTKKSQFCRGTNHYKLWWNEQNKAKKKAQDRARYLANKKQK